MISQSLAEAVRSPAARLAAARGGSADRPFKPKYCRTRSCNKLFGHDLGCVGVSTKAKWLPVEAAVVKPTQTRRQRQKRRDSTRAERARIQSATSEEQQ